MSTPAQIIQQHAAQHQAQREQTRSEERALKLTQLENVLNSISSDDPEAVTKRTSILQAMGSLYHPHEGKDFLKHLSNLAGRITGRRPETTLQPPPVGIPGTDQTIGAGPATKVKGPRGAPAPQKEDPAQQIANLIAQNYKSPQEIAQEAQTRQELKRNLAVWGLYTKLSTAPGVTEEQKQALGSLFGFAPRGQYKEFLGPNGQRQWFDVTQPWTIPAGFNAMAGGHIITKLLNVKGRGWSQVSYDPTTGLVSAIMPGATPPRSLLPTKRTSTTTDPFGVTSTTSSLSQPVYRSEVDLQIGAPIPASAMEAISASPSIDEMPSPEAPKGAAPAPPPAAAPPAAAPKTSRGPAPKKTEAPALDAQGHIPETAGVNPGLRNAANQLLDGMDLQKLSLPQRDKEAAANLAAQYGWKQGLFTPKEQIQLREAETFLKEGLNSPSLDVLNNGASRQKLVNVLRAAENQAGFLSRTFATAVPLTQKESDFLSFYRQLLGTVQGLSSLTRSGRATEAGIKRLMSELPNPQEVHSAADGKKRIQRLLNELSVAQQKGYLSDEPAGPAPRKTIVVTAEDMQ